MNARLGRSLSFALVALAALTAGCERPPPDSVQRGFRGTGMVEVYNPRIVAQGAAINALPEVIPAVPPGGPQATEIFKNVQVLKDLSVAEFTRVMMAITAWVAPQEGCLYCHDGADLAADTKYQKVVARRMLQMTRQINKDWQPHVAATGVTCYTCHRGQKVPAVTWTHDPGPVTAKGDAGNRAGQNWPAPLAGMASLPYDPLTPFIEEAKPIRVVSTTALPADNRASIKQAEWTYSLMMHISDALGVNCTYCHNSRSFANWNESTPQRATAFQGLAMVRSLNNDYLGPLASVLPPERRGKLGDAPKADCATCHRGAFKPLYGAPMARDYPELGGQPGVPAGLQQAALTTAAPAAADATAGAGGPAPVAVAVPAGPGAAAVPAAGAAAAPAAPVTVAVATPAAAPAAAALPAGVLGRVLFEVGKTAILPDGRKAIDAAVAALKADPALRVDLSGFADKSGNPDANLVLAKDRAFAVRDALKAAGVPETRINLRKPEFVIGGLEAEARRVDIVSTK